MIINDLTNCTASAESIHNFTTVGVAKCNPTFEEAELLTKKEVTAHVNESTFTNCPVCMLCTVESVSTVYIINYLGHSYSGHGNHNNSDGSVVHSSCPKENYVSITNVHTNGRIGKSKGHDNI